MKRVLLLLLCLPLLSACAVPHKAIRADYISYNKTIQYNHSQEMLYNLVRLRYRESPMFLQVGALSATYNFEGNAEASLGRVRDGSVYGIDVGTSFSTRPTITYTPLQGNTFVKQVLAEVEPETFILLLRSGWPVRTLAHVMIEKIGPYFNDEDETTYQEFLNYVDTLDDAQDRDGLQFVYGEDETIMLEVITDRQGLTDPEGDGEVREHYVPFESFQLRSFLDIMFFLGKNTRVPDPHADRVRSTDPNGWIDIRYAKDAPADALVAVEHSGYDFYIANNDVKSKDTFALVKLLFQIQAGDIRTAQPILTLPVAVP